MHLFAFLRVYVEVLLEKDENAPFHDLFRIVLIQPLYSSCIEHTSATTLLEKPKMTDLDFRLRQPSSSLTKHNDTYPSVDPSKFVEAHVGKTVLITGGGHGLGKAMALAFANAGASIAIIGRSQQPLSATASEIEAKGNKCVPIAGDITDSAFVKRAVAECVEKLGGIDILINNAGIGRFSTLAADDMAKWWAVYEINVLAVANMIHAVLPVMFSRSKGTIFNIASDSGAIGIPFATAYSSSKSAVIKLTEVLSWEVASKGVRVYAIHPGTINTGFASDQIINQEEVATNSSMKWMLEMKSEFQEDTPELSANGLVALADMSESEAKALNGRYINLTRDVGELIEGVRAGKLGDLTALLTVTEM
jgi:NAD(P)-dependent dehydrogenase (short-subunit alcohol dehydrogenase family)